MVFQRPNPFPMSIYDNVVYGPRTQGIRKREELDCLVEESLKRSALWGEVKGSLKKHAFELSGGQQQRLCIARALATQARGDADGRARLGARSDLDPADRGHHRRAQAVGDHRHRDAQHAAGRPHLRSDRLHAARVDGDAGAPDRGGRDQGRCSPRRTTSAPKPTSPVVSASRGASPPHLGPRSSDARQGIPGRASRVSGYPRGVGVVRNSRTRPRGVGRVLSFMRGGPRLRGEGSTGRPALGPQQSNVRASFAPELCTIDESQSAGLSAQRGAGTIRPKGRIGEAKCGA